MQTKSFTYSITVDLAKSVFFSGETIEKRSTEQKIGFSIDHLGNTRVVYEAEWDMETSQVKFNLKGAYDYFPYGKILRSYVPGNGYERYLTTGHERDHETISENNAGTGLDNRGARFYDSDVARFLSLDPAAMEYPSLSDYNYVAGNPVMFIDPDGKRIDDYFSKSGLYLGSDGIGNQVRVHRTITTQSEFQSSLRTSVAFGTRTNSDIVKALADRGLGKEIYRGSLGSKGENSYSFILDTEQAIAYPSKNTNVTNSTNSSEDIAISRSSNETIVRDGDASSQILIGNIHAHKNSVSGVSMNGDVTSDGQTDEATANKIGVSIYATDKNGVSKVNSAGAKTSVGDVTLTQDALNDYINNK